MVGLLLMTHAPLGTAFLQAAAHVFRSKPERLEAIDVVADQNVDEVNRLALEAVRRLDDGSGVLIMTDILGGTPSNCCRHLGDPNQVAVIAGISLPMLLRAYLPPRCLRCGGRDGFSRWSEWCHAGRKSNSDC